MEVANPKHGFDKNILT